MASSDGGGGMVGKAEVFGAADRIRARVDANGARERVSVRSVRRELGRGSFGDIGRELAMWKLGRGYRAVIEAGNLPDALQRRLGDFAEALAEHVRVEQTRERMVEAANVEVERAACRETLDEALAHADALEARVLALQAELARLRAAADPDGEGTTPEIGPEPDPKPVASRAPAGTSMERKLNRDADAFWAQVRAAVTRELRRRGPVSATLLHAALPDSLKRMATEVGLPLTRAWLRYHLLRMAEAGDGLAEADGLFRLAVAEAGPPEPFGATATGDEAVHGEAGVAGSGKVRFWRGFLRKVYDILVGTGPLPTEDILERLPSEWIEATNGRQRITPARLRYKLRQRIVEGRPFAELPGGRFAALQGEPPWDGVTAPGWVVRAA